MRITGQFPPACEDRLRHAARMIACHYARELEPLHLPGVTMRYRAGMLSNWCIRWTWCRQPVILLSQGAFEDHDDYLGQSLMLALFRLREGWLAWLFRWLRLPDITSAQHEVSKAINAWRLIQKRED